MNEFERRLLDTVKFTSWIASFADPAREVVGIENYAYTAAMARGASLTAATVDGIDMPLIMDSDSEFIVVYMSGAAVVDAPVIVAPANANRITEYTPAIAIQVTEQSSGKTFFNIPTPMPLVCGAGGFPFVLSSPRIILPRTTLTVHAEAPDGVDAAVSFSQLQVVLHGAKIYYAGPTP